MNATKSTNNKLLLQQLQQFTVNSAEKNALFFKESTEQSICFLLAIAQQNWPHGKSLLSLIVEQQVIQDIRLIPPILGGILWHFHQEAPNETKSLELLDSFFEPAIEYHQYLYSNFDIDDKGLIKENAVIDPFFQSILAWSNQSLIKIGQLLEKDTTELILWNELSIYSCQDELWNTDNSFFHQIKKEKTSLFPPNSPLSFLPLFGNILIQEDAENMLAVMQKSGYPLDENGKTIIPPKGFKLTPATGYILLLGLQNYDMNEAANSLKTYLIQEIKSRKKTEIDTAVSFLLNG